jgi:molecular chaperone HscB
MMDPFDVLSLEPRFDLAPARMERAYLAAVGAAHPDSAAGRGAGGAEGPDPARINEARRILVDPERRAEALLRRLGGPGKDADRSLPDGFLVEVMELRQQIEADLEAVGDEARAKWEDWAQQQRDERIGSVGALFAGLSDPPDPEQLGAIRTELNAWRYLERLIEQLDPEYDPAASDFDR